MPPDIKSMRSIGNLPSLEDDSENMDVERLPTKKAKKIKGFDGEVTETSVEQMARMTPLQSINSVCLSSFTLHNFLKDTFSRSQIHQQPHL